MNDAQLLRYSRHILLEQIDIVGQTTLLQSHALIIGAGGLGSPAALYLAAAGIGTLTICDADHVDLTNLQRQIIHTEARVGQNKAQSAQQSLQQMNQDISVHTLPYAATAENLPQILMGQANTPPVSIVLDCSDNFSTRHALNRACFAAKIPLVSGAAVRFEGQVSVFNPQQTHSPCYQCLYPEAGENIDIACGQLGVFSPLVGIVGSMQAAEAIKVLLNIGETLCGRLWLIDALTMQTRSLRLLKDSACPICSPI